MKYKLLPLMLGTIMIFAGCKADSENIDATETQAAVTEATATKKDADIEEITESEIERLIEGRIYIRTVTEYDTLPFDSDVKIEHKGHEYYKVSDSRFEKWSDWAEFIREFYSENMEEELLTQSNTIGIDGFTYTDGGGMGREWSDEYSYEPAGEYGNGIAYNVRLPYYTQEDGYYEETLVFVHTDNGWRIDEKIS